MAMEDKMQKIIDYVTMQMTQAEETAFESAMAEDEDLRVAVLLEQLRFNNIHKKIKENLHVNDIPGDLKLSWWANHKKLLLSAASVVLAVAVWGIIEKVNLDNKAEVSSFFAVNPIESEIKAKDNKHDSLNITSLRAPVVSLNEKTNKRKRMPSGLVFKTDSYYIGIADSVFNLDKITWQNESAGDIINPGTISLSEKALKAYENGDSATVHQFYRINPSDELGLKLEGCILFKYRQFDEAALVFHKLATYECCYKMAEWNELLCYAARYRDRHQAFVSLAEQIKGKHHTSLINELLLKLQ
jgi:hypothetical protein